MVIGDRPLEELVPLYRDPKSSFPITQFNWKLVEAAGLVKFDFLGLKTLTVLQKAVELIKRGRGIDIDLAKLPLDDKKSYEMLARADTVGVFQLEGTGMRESLKRLKPDRFEDIIAMVALYRPGPMDNIPTYINRKHGEEPLDCLHPMLEPILKETYGVIIYQEQVMQIAQVMAGFSLGEADLLRRAMGKKDKREMAQQKTRFVEGATRNGVKKADAEYIFELVDKFAGYGFNKSHAAAYAVVSYHTAYLKANYREEFLAASMTLDMGNTDKLAMYASEAKKSGIALLPPCINASEVDFLSGDKTIRYSLAALKNIGAQAVESLVAERTAQGAYKDLSDFAGRCNPKALNKRALETLSSAGAFDEFEPNRALAHGNVDQILAFSNRIASNEAQGTNDLFGGGSEARPTDGHPPGQGLEPHGAAAVRIRRRRFLPLRPSAGRLCRRACQAQHHLLRRVGGARGSRRCRRPRCRRCRVGARTAIAERQQVCVRDVLGADRPVRGRDLLGDLGPEPAAARARNGRADLGRGRARWRHPQAARAGHRVL